MDFSRNFYPEDFKKETKKLQNRLFNGRTLNQTHLVGRNIFRPTYVNLYFILKF